MIFFLSSKTTQKCKSFDVFPCLIMKLITKILFLLRPSKFLLTNSVIQRKLLITCLVCSM